MAEVVARRPDFRGIEKGLDGPTLKAMRTLAGKADHQSRSVINAACGGLWMNDRRARVFDKDPACAFCHEGIGTPQHVVFDCPFFAAQRKEAQVGTFRETVPACVQTFGLGIQFPQELATVVEPSPGTTEDTLLFTDGSGKHPTEPNHRKCGCGISGETTKITLYRGVGSLYTKQSFTPSCSLASVCKDKESL
eukprot:2017560-Amphidinium_carterae.1